MDVQRMTRSGRWERLGAAWRNLPPQRRSALASLAALTGLMAALLLYQRPAPLRLQPVPPRPVARAPAGAPAATAPAGVPAAASAAPAAAGGVPEAASAAPAPEDTGRLDTPLRGRVTRGFGWAPAPGTAEWRLHAGLDLAGQPGDAVAAAAAGTVLEVREDALLGWTLVLDHGGGRRTRYAGLEQPELGPGARVSRSQVIGRLGRPGPIEATAGPHLHFAVEVDGEPVDPALHLGR